MKRNKVAIIFGGKSAEHEVSLASATNVYQAMNKERFMPVLIGINKSGEWFYNGDYPSSTVNLTENDYFQKAQNVYLSSTGDNIKVINKKDNTVLTDFNVAFPIVHGTFGEDGTLQGILKSAGIPFVGPDVLASAIAMDKDIAKRLFQLEGIPVASSYTVYKHNASSYTFKQITDRMGLPCFVKPANAGSSVGVSKVRSRAHTPLLCQASQCRLICRSQQSEKRSGIPKRFTRGIPLRQQSACGRSRYRQRVRVWCLRKRRCPCISSR